MAIYDGLIEAYKGYYEDEWQDEFSRSPDGAGNFAMTYQQWLTKKTEETIKADTPKRRLEIYLEWNGILGYTEIIWDLSQGEFEVR